MPLSEREERVLAEIERQLEADDRKFVETISNTTLTRMYLRRLRFAVIGFIVGLIAMLGLTFNFAFGPLGFAIMLVSVIGGAIAVRNLTTAENARAISDQLKRAFRRGEDEAN